MSKESKKFSKCLKKYGYNKKTFESLANLLAKTVSKVIAELDGKGKGKKKDKKTKAKHRTSSPKIKVKTKKVESAKGRVIKDKIKMQETSTPKPKKKKLLKFTTNPKTLKKFADMEDGFDFTVANPNFLKKMKKKTKSKGK